MAELEISHEFNRILEKADKTFEKMATSIMNMEGSMDKLIKNGFEPLNANVGKIVEMMSRLSGIKIGDLGLNNTAQQAQQAAASVAELSNTFDKFKIDRTKPIFDFTKENEYIIALNTQIEELRQKLYVGISSNQRKAIEAQYEGDDKRIENEIKKTISANKKQQQDLVNQWRALQDQLKVSLTSTDKWNEDNAKKVVKEYENIRKILLDIEKLRSNASMLPDSPQKASLLGSIDQTKKELSDTSDAYEKEMEKMRNSRKKNNAWEKKLAEELNNIKVRYDQKRAEEQLRLSARVSKEEEANVRRLISEYKALLNERGMLELSVMRGQSGGKVNERYDTINERIRQIEDALGKSEQRLSAERRQAAKDEINEFKLSLEQKKKALQEYEKAYKEITAKKVERDIVKLSDVSEYQRRNTEITKLLGTLKSTETAYKEETDRIKSKYDEAYKEKYKARLEEMKREYASYQQYIRQLNEEERAARELMGKSKQGTVEYDLAKTNIDNIKKLRSDANNELLKLKTQLGDEALKIEAHYNSLEVKDSLNAIKEKERQEKAYVEQYRRLMEEKAKIEKRQQVIIASPLDVKTSLDLYDKLGERKKAIENEINEIKKKNVNGIDELERQLAVRAGEEKIRKLQEEQRQELAAVEQLYAEKFKLQEQYSILRQRKKLGLETDEELKIREQAGRRIRQINDEINNRKVKLSKEGLDKIARLEKQHEDKKRREAINNIDHIRKKEIEAAKEAKKAQENYTNALRISTNVKSFNDDKLAIEALQRAKMSLSRSDSDYTAKLNELNKRLIEHKTRLKDAEEESKTLGEQQRKLSAIADYMAKRFAVYFSVTSLVNFGKKLAEVRGEMEMQQKSLQFLLNDKDKANMIWEQTLDLAVKSPFRITELTSYIKQMAAYRIESDKLFDTTKRLADVSAGLGVDMSRLILAYGQVRAATFLRGTELRQFTEAGIPMLEALAERFSKLEKRVVTAADVFARISKRQVYFEDVEAVMKEMTDKGGLFYKMQEKQANTLKGMISNLRDSIDIAMNEIGKNNEGMMKSMVSMTKTLADNWRVVFTIIKQTTTAFGLFALVKIVKGFAMTEEAVLGVKGAFAGLTKAGYSLKKMFIGLGTVIKANPWIALGAVVISAGWALWDYSNAIDAANKKYDEMNDRILNTRRKVDDLTKSLNENAKTIKQNEQKMSELSETTDEYKIADAELQDAQKSNKQIIKELTSLYPMLKGEIDTTKLADDEYIETIKKKIKVTSAWMVLINEKAKGGWTYQDTKKNVAQAYEEEMKLMEAYDMVKVSLTTLEAEMEAMKDAGQITEEQYKSLMEVVKSYYKESYDAERKFAYGTSGVGNYNMNGTNITNDLSNVMRGFGNVSKGTLDAFNMILNKAGEAKDYMQGWVSAAGNFNSSLNNLGGNFNNMYYQILGLSRAYDLSTEKGRREFAAMADEMLRQWGAVDGAVRDFAREEVEKIVKVKIEGWMTKEEISTLLENKKDSILDISREFDLKLEEDKEKFMRKMKDWMKQLGIVDGELKKFAAEKINKIIGIQLVWKWGNDEEELDGWRKTIQDEINDFNNKLKGTDQEFRVNIRIKGDANLEDVQSAIASARKTAMDRVEQAKRDGIFFKKGDATTLQKSVDFLEKIGKKLHMDFTEKGKGGSSTDPWQKRVQTLIEMHRTFLSLNKTFDVSNSKMMTMEKHAEGIKEYLKSVLDMDKIDISTEEGTIAALQVLLDKIPKKSKAAIYAVTKAIAEFRHEVKETTKKTEDEDIIKRFERQISDYKSAQELIKKGFRPSQIRSWFGFDAEAFSIDNVKKNLELDADKFTGTEMEKKYKELITKIDDIQAQENRTMYENYIEYVKKGIDERFSLKVQELRELENLERSSNLNAYEKEEIRDAIKKKYGEKLDTLTWNEFKKTDMYTDMFGELGKMSTKVLTNMRSQLNKLKSSLTGLSPADMKAITTQINKIGDEIEKREPLLKRTIDLYNKIKSSGMSRAEAERVYAEAGNEIIKNNEEINRLTDERIALERKLDEVAKNPDSAIVGEAYDLRQNIANLTVLINNLKLANKTANNQQKGASDTMNWWQEFLQNLPKIGQAIGSTMQSAGDFVRTISTSFGTMNKETTDMLESIASATESIGGAVTSIATLADGKNYYDPTKWMSAASSLMKVFGTFLSIADKKFQREIENREKLIGRLERAYGKLEKALENAYSTSSMRYYYAESEKNLQRQMDNYKAMAELERQKKNYDLEKIQEYKDKVEDLQEQIQELQDQRIQAYGGFGESGAKSAAEEFASAWLDAFMETGSGLNSLQDTFDDFIKNIIKNQLLQRASQTILDPIFKMIDAAVDGGELTTQELDRINSKWENETKPKLDAAYQQIMSLYEGMFDTGAGDLSELQKGIQNITEAQAAAIEAYLNSIRFFVSDIDSKMQSIDLKIDSIDISPIVGELKAQTAIVTTIRDMLDSVIGRGGSSVHAGAYLKVMM